MGKSFYVLCLVKLNFLLTVDCVLARQNYRNLEYLLWCRLQKTFEETNQRNIAILFDQQIVSSIPSKKEKSKIVSYCLTMMWSHHSLFLFDFVVIQFSLLASYRIYKGFEIPEQNWENNN